eukprot:GHVR01077366.1.p1 GENE.GHVR01077366.1~~GHVR01077366.1.p1  ORF type:complete len:121 (-),score=7.24 GHVR01077366.1:133-495(-)
MYLYIFCYQGLENCEAAAEIRSSYMRRKPVFLRRNLVKSWSACSTPVQKDTKTNIRGQGRPRISISLKNGLTMLMSSTGALYFVPGECDEFVQRRGGTIVHTPLATVLKRRVTTDVDMKT